MYQLLIFKKAFRLALNRKLPGNKVKSRNPLFIRRQLAAWVNLPKAG
jgi:hypothetical protein